MELHDMQENKKYGNCKKNVYIYIFLLNSKATWNTLVIIWYKKQI